MGGRGRRRKKTEDRRQMTASQMVNLSTSQMVMNGVNDALTTSTTFTTFTISTAFTISAVSTNSLIP